MASFELIGDSKEFITTYTFGTHTAKHTFCKVCGITSFYIPRSNPDGIAVKLRCVDPGTLTHVEIKCFDGQNWEEHHVQRQQMKKTLNDIDFFGLKSQKHNVTLDEACCCRTFSESMRSWTTLEDPSWSSLIKFS